MPYIDPKYDRLFLTDDYITDPLLLALAWKKAHEYIRSTNWYADNFELDKSALNLAELCGKWSNELSNTVTFSPLHLVPAPKSAKWDFVEKTYPDFSTIEGAFQQLNSNLSRIDEQCYCHEWAPVEEVKLRPLAHAGIKEQTYMTLVMLCLADDVETRQGDPATEYKDVHDKKIVSYGNRLFCTYQEDGSAVHNYGATTTYGKYFTDYRKFLQRPYYFASEALPEKSPDEEIYLVELDLRKFFDLVNRQKLFEKIGSIAKNQAVNKPFKHDLTKNLLNHFIDWKWSNSTHTLYNLCAPDNSDKVPEPPKGLPQGLVASGFLSNVYMLDFDAYMSELIGKKIPASDSEHNLILIDYCRYVDDMRLVIIGPSREKVTGKNLILEIKNALNAHLKTEFDKLELAINEEKTKIEIYRGKSRGISVTLEDIQIRGSGPVSHEDTGELISQLDSLLMLSSNSTKALDQNGANCKINTLALIEKDVFDVRDDTIKRFAANKLSRMLNHIRHFTSRDTDENGRPIAGEWDYLQERIARHFIASWSHDPALVLLLKKGMELFPSPKLLAPVLDQLSHVRNKYNSSDMGSRKQAAVARYCLAEIFRHSAMVIHRKDPQAIPAHADIGAYFERLQHLAASLLKPADAPERKSDTGRTGDFDFLLDQARFLLMTRLDTVLETSSGNDDQDLIFKLAKGFRNIAVKNLHDTQAITTSVLIASQLVTDQKPVIRAVSCLLDSNNINTQEILEKIAYQNPMLFQAITLHARPLSYSWHNKNNRDGFIKALSDKLYISIKPSAKPLGEIKGLTALYKLSSRPDNPFANEILALKLMLGLIEKPIASDIDYSNKIIDLSRTKVALFRDISSGNASNKTVKVASEREYLGYSIPPTYEVFDCSVEIEFEFQEPISKMAEHLMCDAHEAAFLQKVSLAMRAVLAGTADPTGFGQSFTPRPGYQGIKSTIFKRQLGMITTPESLVGENAQFSGWLTTLLAKLLRWPGIHVNDQGFDWPIELTLGAVKKLIEQRLDVLKKNYCQLSGMPALSELITPNWAESKKSLTVAIIQSKLPFKEDFTSAGILLNDARYRVKHRRHVARVAQLAIKHIESQSVEPQKNGRHEKDIDLIVWPELSVHKDDVDILIHLSRKTNAIIFAGLGFIHQPSIKGPNNCAIWIVPRKHGGNSNEITRYQGKFHMMEGERKIEIQGWRPYQLLLELKHPKFKDKQGFILTGSICFDATNISLSADLRDKSNAFIVSALNRDVNSFDSMVEALHYHMYQPVVLVNTGEFGGSYAMAPYKAQHKRLIAHSTGNNQVAINTFEMNMFDFRRDGVGKSMTSSDETKTPPAGVLIK